MLNVSRLSSVNEFPLMTCSRRHQCRPRSNEDMGEIPKPIDEFRSLSSRVLISSPCTLPVDTKWLPNSWFKLLGVHLNEKEKKRPAKRKWMMTNLKLTWKRTTKKRKLKPIIIPRTSNDWLSVWNSLDSCQPKSPSSLKINFNWLRCVQMNSALLY